MKTFASDNTSGTHPKLLDAMIKANSGHAQSYGLDPWTDSFSASIKKTFGEQATGYLVFNGTAANVLGLSTAVKSFQGVICSADAHLTIDECGAPEKWLGAKLFLAPSYEGKIHLEDLDAFIIRRGDQHFSQASVLSVTQPTEMGTVYSLEELKGFSKFCKTHGLIFHLDGARLANAVHTLGTSFKALTTDVGVDIVSLGGTKNGMMLGEAVVFLKSDLEKNFKFIRKQGLQLASKQRFLAAPFVEYLETGLYKDISEHVCNLAKYLEQQVREIPDVKIIAPVQSNAVFAKIPKNWNKPLKDKFFFYVWNEFENSVRWMITWDHTKSDIDDFVSEIKNCAKMKS